MSAMRPAGDPYQMLRRREVFDWIRLAILVGTLVSMFVSGRDDLRNVEKEMLEMKARVSHVESYLEKSSRGDYTTREDVN